MMKNTLIKVFSVLAVALCMTACGNDGGTSDKSVTTTTSETLTTTTGPVVTTTVATVTNEPEEVVTTTTSSSSEDTTTTTEPTSSTSDVDSESTTTTPKVTTTKKPTTVTTTTTKKKATTTTTAKKSTPTTTITTTSAVKGKTMWISQMTGCYEINGDSWKQISGVYADWGEKVTAYETVTVYEGYKFTRCKFSDGTYTYIRVDDLRTTDPAITDDPLPDGYKYKFTEKDIEELKQLCKDYAISRGVTWDATLTRENSSWSGDSGFYEYNLFFDMEDARERIKEDVDYWIEVLKETCERNNTEFKGVLGLEVVVQYDEYRNYPKYWQFYILR